jgi:uncharacterized protein YoxC
MSPETAITIGVIVGVVLAIGLLVLIVRLIGAITQAQQLMALAQRELPTVLKEVRETVDAVQAIVTDVRGGVGHASQLLHAVGRWGEALDTLEYRVHRWNRLGSANLGVWMAGLRAATRVVAERLTRGGQPRRMADNGSH